MPAESQVRPGLHTVTLSVYDYGGNTTQTQVSYIIDSSAPTGSLTAPADQSHHANFPAFSGTASDANGIQTVDLFIRRARDATYWNGASWDQKPKALSSSYNSGTQTFTSNFPLPNAGVNAVGGVYYYDAIATDAAGNYYQFGATVVVDYYAIYQWTGTSINANNLWDDPANWYSTSDMAFVPGPDDVVVISTGTPQTFTGQNISVRELRLNGGTLTAGNLHVGTALKMTGGTFTGALHLENGSSSEWKAGRITGQLTVDAGATLSMPIPGESNKYLGGPGAPANLNNSGTVVWTSNYPVQGSGGVGSEATINNLSTGVFDIARDGDPVDYSASTVGLSFNNSGRIVKSSGTGVSNLFTYWAFTNEPGAVIHSNVSAGRLQRGSSMPTLWKSGTIFRGPGTIGLNNGTIASAAGSWTIEGNAFWDLTGGTLSCPQSGELALIPGAGSSLQWSGGTLLGNLSIPAGVTLSMPANGSLKTMGALDTHATLNLAGTLLWHGGNPIRDHDGVTAGAAINITSTGIFDIAADGYPLDSNSGSTTLHLNNSGSIRKTAGTGTTFLNAIWTLHNAGQLHASTGTLDLSGTANLNAGSTVQTLGAGQCSISNGLITVNATVGIGGTSPLVFSGGTLAGNPNGLGIINGGILNWTGGSISGSLGFGVNLQVNLTGSSSKTIATAATLSNAGIITWTAGSLLGNGSSTLTNLASGTFNVPAGADFNYSGGGNALINAGVLNIGTGASSMSLPSPWSFSQTSTGRLNVEIGGTATTDYDRILCGGSAALGGSVHITFVNGFVPSVGSTFTMMTYGSHTGAFATISSAGAFLSRTYNVSDFTLTAVSAPSNYAAWKNLHFGAGSPDAGDSLDPDHDGVSNLLEYATGTNPTIHSALSTPLTKPAAGTVTFTYSRSVAAKSEAVFQVIWKDDLAPTSWSSTGVTESIVSEDNGIEQVRATIPAGSLGRRFFRLSVTPIP